MEKITVNMLLSEYKKLVEAEEIQFLAGKADKKKEVINNLAYLISDFKSANEKAIVEKESSGKMGNLSDYLNWYELHNKGNKLWRILVSCALSDVDRDSKGNSKLFEFLDDSTKFEDLLYGLDVYYRDHTLHSLWVYFLGQFLLKNKLNIIYENLNWYLFNDVEFPDKIRKEAIDKENAILSEVDKKKDSIWCVMALCHDLGYSFEKLTLVNEKVKSMLRYIDVPDFKHMGYTLDIEHQYHVSQFLELMAMDVRIVPSEDLKESIIKGYRDDSTYWRLCRAFEKKQHGILSSYLIFKVLSIFADAWMRGSMELDKDEAQDNLIRGDILYAIAQHQFDFAYLKQFNSLSDLLILCDELEEFSRYGRQMLSRRYFDTIAETSVNFLPKEISLGGTIEIEIMYEVAEHLDENNVLSFFARKAKRLCEIYSLGLQSEKEDAKYCTINKITMTVSSKWAVLNFQLDKESLHAHLPAYEDHKEDKYELICEDDKLYILLTQETVDEKIGLEKWLKIK